MSDLRHQDRERPDPGDRGSKPAETEIPAGPGDAGASDVPEHLENEPRQHPARARDGNVLIKLLWAVAIISVLYVIIWD